MEITCYQCKTVFEVPAGTMTSARLRYALGYKEVTFPCPNCGAKNSLTYDEFHSYAGPQNVVPVTGARSGPEPVDDVHPDVTNETATRAPVNPVEGTKHWPLQRQAVVRVRGVEARRDHSIWSEVMGSFRKGEKITIVDTWSDGENTWVQLGPERWVNIQQDGEPVLDLMD